MKLQELSSAVKAKRTNAIGHSDMLIKPLLNVGIELEIEGCNTREVGMAFVHSCYWEVVADGSLRNGCEIRTTGPVFGDDLLLALQDLETTLKLIDYTTSHRTSTHVHIDTSSIADTKELVSFLIVSCIFEKALFNLVGKGRYNSIYCLPYAKSRSDFVALSSVNESLHADGFGKYQAINLNALFIHGTVEFRHAEALTTTKKLCTWINTLASLLNYVQKGTGADTRVLEAGNLPILCSRISPLDFFKDVFNEELQEALFYKGIEADIINGCRVAEDILASATLYGTFPGNVGNVHKEELVYKSKIITAHREAIVLGTYSNLSSKIFKNVEEESKEGEEGEEVEVEEKEEDVEAILDMRRRIPIHEPPRHQIMPNLWNGVREGRIVIDDPEG